jgi:glutamate racemase
MIGIFDSGIGGLTTLQALAEKLPGYDMIYLGDTAHSPYGNKSQETVAPYLARGIDFLLNRGAKLIVIACHTASAFGTEPSAGKSDIPVFEPIIPSAALAVKTSKKQIIGIIGTHSLTASGIYEKKIREISPGARVWQAACPLIAPLIEEGRLKKPETRVIVKKYLHSLKVRQIDTLILAHAYYPVLADLIQRKIGKRVRIIDSSLAVADKVKHFLENRAEADQSLSKTGKTEFFVSDITQHLQKSAKSILRKNVPLICVRI